MMESDDENAEEDGDETEQRSTEIGYGVRSINGKALGNGKPLQVKQGQRVLFHVLNASATENVQLHLPGHKFHVVALDGNPVPRPGYVSVLELGVGEYRVSPIYPGIDCIGSVKRSLTSWRARCWEGRNNNPVDCCSKRQSQLAAGAAIVHGASADWRAYTGRGASTAEVECTLTSDGLVVLMISRALATSDGVP
jgi:hypothetical protein